MRRVMKRGSLVLVSITGILLAGMLTLGGCGGSTGNVKMLPTLTATPTQPGNGGLPADIPIYPNAQFIGSPSQGQASFQAPATQAMVSTFYQQQMPQHGWKTTQVQESGTDVVILTFRKDTRTVHIVIAPGSSAGQSSVLITVGNS